jgi:hypothetical protein
MRSRAPVHWGRCWTEAKVKKKKERKKDEKKKKKNTKEKQ